MHDLSQQEKPQYIAPHKVQIRLQLPASLNQSITDAGHPIITLPLIQIALRLLLPPPISNPNPIRKYRSAYPYAPVKVQCLRESRIASTQIHREVFG